MPNINQQITFLYTRDLQATAHFYENILGLPLDRDQGDCRIYQVTPTAFIGFCQREHTLENPPLILTLITDDVDNWYTDLQSKGVIFERLPATNPKYNIYHCFLRDPNGYRIEIQRFLD